MRARSRRPRYRSKSQLAFFSVVMTLLTLVTAGIVGRDLLLSQIVNEGRAVADMVEYIGQWASQYGGAHIKRTESDSGYVGSYLRRTEYRQDEQAGNSKPKTSSNSYEAYHWKNPALIQREVSDISALSASGTRFKLTAKSVMNLNNQPTPFEKEAIEKIDVAFSKMPPSDDPKSKLKNLEYWKVEGNTLRFARALIADKNCLACHGTFDSAPSFLRENSQFNGGGGFGYVAGAPAGIISVTVPLERMHGNGIGSISYLGWAALLITVVVGVAMLIGLTRRITMLERVGLDDTP